MTLLTGDRVTVSGSDPSVASVQRGSGRGDVTFLVERVSGHLTVIPSDAVSLVRAGRLDRRLFDVTSLVDSGYDDRRAELPPIVTFAGSAKGRAARAGGAFTVPGSCARCQARATPPCGLPGGKARRSGRASPPAGTRHATSPDDVTKVWLDGMRKPTLDVSVPRIGAPAAWQAGYTGSGVPVAVLDTAWTPATRI